jgi:hypothetical protein
MSVRYVAGCKASKGIRYRCYDKHRAIVQPVRAPHNRVELLAIGRPCRLELTHKVAQRLLVCDGVHHCSHGCLGLCERSLSDLEEQGVLAGNSFEIGD